MGIRKNQNKLSDAEKTRFVNAVKKMKVDAAAAYNYDKYPTIHSNAFPNDVNSNPAHMGPAFFPWHRHFLRKFESDLEAADRALGGDGTITLPYWDWTHDNSGDPDSQRGSIWRPNFMGGAGNPVTDGPFRASDWPQQPGTVPNQFAREFGRDIGSLPTESEVNTILALEGFDTAPWDTGAVAGPAVAAPSTPVLTAATVAGATLAPGAYRVAITYFNSSGETRPSPEGVITLAAPNNAIAVASPAASGSATLYAVYVSPVGGAANSKTRQTNPPVALGSAASITTVAAGAAMPTLNSTGSFRNACEGWVGAAPPEMHNRVHVWVGGSMSPGTSPNDPVFFLHHCNIDRIWALWQYRHPGQNYPEVVPTSPPSGVNRPHGLNDLMPPWTAAPEMVRPADVLNHRAMGYSYDTDPSGLSINISP